MMSKTATPPGIEEEALNPQWLKDMRAYFIETGTYRTEDVQKVLGDPRIRVEVQGSIEASDIGAHPGKGKVT